MALLRLAVDLTPFRVSTGFRWLYAARLSSLLSYGVLGVAINLQTYELTGSSLHVALLNLVMAVPMMAFLIVGGILADRHDRRTLMLWARSAYVASSLILVVNAALPAPSVMPIYAAALVSGITGGISVPALMAATPALIGRNHLAAAGALSAMAAQAGAIIGPFVAGMLIAQAGFLACYVVVAIGTGLTPLCLSRLPSLPPAASGGGAGAGARRPAGAAAFRESLAFVSRSPLIMGLLLIDLFAMILATPTALFPEVGLELLEGGGQSVGLLYAAPATGAFLAALTSGWTGRTAWPGRALIAAVAVWGMAVAAFGLSPHIVPAFAFLVLMGFADTVSEILRVALLQRHTPNELLGRVSSFWMMQSMVSPALGNVQIGFLARILSPRTALLAGGLASMAITAVLAATFPALRGRRDRQAVPEAAGGS